MGNKIAQVSAYMFHAAVAAIVYGLASYFFIYRGIAREVMLYAYLWNIVFIIICLILDKIANEILLAKEYVITEANYFASGLLHMFSFISFKTTLYLFYTFVLIVSRVSILEPELISDGFRGFVLSIEYCLILVVTFDKFIEHLTKDDMRIKRISAKFTKFTNFVKKRRKKPRP